MKPAHDTLAAAQAIVDDLQDVHQKAQQTIQKLRDALKLGASGAFASRVSELNPEVQRNLTLSPEAITERVAEAERLISEVEAASDADAPTKNGVQKLRRQFEELKIGLIGKPE